ncbi:MAG: methyltransferase family protein [Chloroflexia bacterium]
MHAITLFSGAFLLLAAAWIGLEMWLLAREGAGVLAQADRGSALAIIASVSAAGAAAVACAAMGWGVAQGPGVRWAGLGLMAAGLVLRVWSLATLGRFFTSVVRTHPGHRVVRSGPYRLLRHPSYTGTFLTLLGFGLALGSWLGAALLVLLPLPAYIYRMRVEERVLLSALGPEYAEYMRGTRRMLPWLW